jgi:TRAP-type C4-dicarboxylate transport system substrate-binding protein
MEDEMRIRSVLGTAAAVLIATPLAAQTITLKLNSPAPPRSYLHSGVFEPWAKAVEADSGGTLKIQMFYGGTLGHFGVNYDRVVDGVADIGFILTAMAGGKLKQQDVAALPYETKSSVEAAVALWNIYEKGITAGEFDQVKPLGIWVFPNAALHTKDPVKTLEDVSGKKLVASNLIAAKITTALGGTPLTLGPHEAYQAISRGTADGGLMPFTGMAVFKIHEVAKHHLDEALGSDSALLMMNKQSYAKLPPKAKAAIDKHSYLTLSRKLGEKTTEEWLRTRNLVKDSVTSLSPAEEKKWREALAPIAKEWAANTPNGAKVLEAYRAEIKAEQARAK